MRLIYRGAEADLLLGRWEGERAVHKLRKPLPYRLPVLDEAIRGQRTVHEAQMIHEARAAGVRAPVLYFVDPVGALLVMEYIEGERMKVVIEKSARAEVARLGRSLGESTAKLHRAGIMHGDITTSNVIVRNGGLVLIDFGLSVHSVRLEDHAVDLRLIKETLTGAHSSVSQIAFEAFLEGYREVLGEKRQEATVRKLAEIERRGRYARVE